MEYKVLDESDGDSVEKWVHPDLKAEMDPPFVTLTETKKVNHGKPDLSRVLDAPISLAGIAACLEMGESKDNRTRKSWLDYNDSDGLTSALLRHLMAWQQGEEVDPESGLNHLQHVVTNAVMLCETNPGTSSGETIKGN